MRLRITTPTRIFYWATSERRFRLGRGELCGLRMQGDDAALVSWEHADFHLTNQDMCYVVDLGSSNGTYVGGVRIEAPTALELGSQIQIGRSGPVLELLAIVSSPSADQRDIHADCPDFQTQCNETPVLRSVRRGIRVRFAWIFYLICIVLGAALGLAAGYHILTVIAPDRYGS